MATESALDRGRQSFERKAWGAAYAELSAADNDEPLRPADLELLGVSAVLIGKDDEAEDIGTRAHHEYLRLGNPCRAARIAFWLGMSLFNRGEMARAGGWMGRANRILDEGQLDCPERGYLLVPRAIQTMEGGDAQAGYAMFEEVGKFGERFDEPELLAMSRLGRGQALILQGRTAEGVGWLDEVMVAATADELSPIFTGIVYCAVIDACIRIFDLRRAQEWTTALTRWSDGQPDLVPFRGQCLVDRAWLLHLHGSWPEAVEEATRACDLLSLPSGRQVVGSAFYELAELCRLLGEFDRAEESYRRGNQYGKAPQPGLAQLRLAQGKTDAADAAIRREIDEAKEQLARAQLLPACVEITLASGDPAAAREAADELSQIADELDAPYLRAVSAQAAGAVVLVEGDARAALESLRGALVGWKEMGVPYEIARTRMLIGQACREIGDEDSARMEFDAAQRTFQELGAKPDLARVAKLAGAPAGDATGGLTAREVEVLSLVAAGKTNRVIAKELVISEKTVARHVSNIFTKLGLSSRAAATAYAYQHGLV